MSNATPVQRQLGVRPVSELVRSQYVLGRPASELVRSLHTLVRSVRTSYLEVWSKYIKVEQDSRSKELKEKTELRIVRPSVAQYSQIYFGPNRSSAIQKTIPLGLSSGGVCKRISIILKRMNPRRTLHGEIQVLLGLCHTKLIKAHKHHLGGGNWTQSFW